MNSALAGIRGIRDHLLKEDVDLLEATGMESCSVLCLGGGLDFLLMLLLQNHGIWR